MRARHGRFSPRVAVTLSAAAVLAGASIAAVPQPSAGAARPASIATAGVDEGASVNGGGIDLRITVGGRAYVPGHKKRRVRTTTRRSSKPSQSVARHLSIPPPKATIQPGSTGFVGMPTNFFIDDSAIELETDAHGHTYEFELKPRLYRWTVEPGTVLDTTDPGGSYPDMTVTHTYREPGNYDVRVHVKFDIVMHHPDGGTRVVPGDANSTRPVGRVTVLRAPVERVSE